MSDTQKLILWIVIAVIVIAIVAWLLVRSSRKRREAEQRREARALRAKAAAREADVTRAEDRASVTQQIASDARTEADESHARAQQAMEQAKAEAAEAEQRAAHAERLAQQATAHQSTVGQVQSDRDDLLREADRVDPDVETDEEGRRTAGAEGRPGADRSTTDRSTTDPDAFRTDSDRASDQASVQRDDAPDVAGRDGTRTQPSTWPGAVGVGSAAGAVAAGGISAAAFDDDEPDLADAENPFAASHAGAPEPEQAERQGQPGAFGERNRPEQLGADDVVRDADAGAGDTRGTSPVAPVQGEGRSEGDQVRMTPSGPQGAADLRDRPAGDVFGTLPEFGDPTDRGHLAAEGQGQDAEGEHEDGAEAEVDAADDADWVNSPVDEDAIDDRPVDDVADWINGPSDDESVTMDVPEERSSSAGDPVAAAAAGGSRGGPDTPSDPVGHVIGGMPEQAHVATPEEDQAQHGEQGSEEQGDVSTSEDRGQHLGQRLPQQHGADEDSARAAGTNSSTDGSASAADLGRDENQSAQRPRRRISAFEEVRDGGYGVGSAAPISDGAQPLGHAIKGVRGRRAYLSPGAPGYEDVEPDVWFYDEQYARNAGYRAVTGH